MGDLSVLSFEATQDRFTRLCVASHLSAYHRMIAVANLYIVARNHYLERRGITMASNNGESSGNSRRDFKRFVNVYLADDDKQKIEAEYVAADLADLWSWIAEMTELEYRFSFTYDVRSKAQQVAVFCWAADHQNYGCALSARHPDVSIALFTLMYKHLVVCEGVWPVEEETTYPSWG